MRHTTKRIRRADKARAHAAMARHAERMAARGWTLAQEFGGDSGVRYEVVAVFERPVTPRGRP